MNVPGEAPAEVDAGAVMAELVEAGAELAAARTRERDASARAAYLAGVAVSAGLRPTAIARALGVDRASVGAWLKGGRLW